MAESISPGWGELLATVRRCENGEPLPEPDRQAALELATSVGLDTLAGVSGCSITVRRPEGRFVTPAAAGRVSLILDEVQYAEDDGPCIRAAVTGRAERVDSMAVDERWPALARRAGEVGVRSSLSLPLLTATVPAALNLYGTAEDSFDSARAAAVASVIARATSALLADPAGRPAEGLNAVRIQHAIVERTQIARAQGVLMAREGISAELAYRRLALRSAVEAAPLHDVAGRVLAAAGSAELGPAGLSTGTGIQAGMEAESEAGSASSSGEDVSA